MTQDPESDVATFLAGAGLSLVVGTNLFKGPVRPASDVIPQACVFVRVDAGAEPEPYLGGRTTGSVYEADVEVLIRGEPDRYDAPRQVARAVLVALQKASLPGYFSCVVAQSQPDYLDQDDNQCHEFAVDVTLSWVA
ncbi:hypothetical protein [Myxococcus virescens]|uniref:DUF3168 domain-containing protein n=1 Tax=Myxococcus virescens TaxID=83456 RepID=A0A511HNN3_9BACT|nr:hypothetical protein [Myxococcus virescens]GEL75208.1 hypothetical protein MVI01_69920 [Myxococcus virescens]SDD65270.1 hypothetical protein SAMN04488504_102133 [Myxococcus virescens]